MSYIPRTDSAALKWFQAFRDGIVANPGLYMVSAADATSIANAVDAFQAAMETLVQPTASTMSAAPGISKPRRLR